MFLAVNLRWQNYSLEHSSRISVSLQHILCYGVFDCRCEPWIYVEPYLPASLNYGHEQGGSNTGGRDIVQGCEYWR